MKKVKIIIKETLETVVEVEADSTFSDEEIRGAIERLYDTGEIVLTPDDFKGEALFDICSKECKKTKASYKAYIDSIGDANLKEK